MDQIAHDISAPTDPIHTRTTEVFNAQLQRITRHTDGLFARLMLFQWAAGVAAALWISPRTWSGTESQTHLHVWAALLFGALITCLPVLLALTQPGKTLTRHTIAVGQMLMSALLIHLTGGRIETHFHVFGSLAILAFYRDWPVLISASAVVYLDHVVRGMFWPQSVYGVMSAPIWRSLEHAGWVIFEVTFLIISIRKSLKEMLVSAEREAKLESLNQDIECEVTKRTEELTRENLERRHAEASLHKSQAQLAQAQQMAHLGSWEWDIVQDKVTWSEETRRLYDFKPEDSGLFMAKCVERLHPDDVALVKSALAETLRTGKPFHSDHRIVLPNGTERILHGCAEVVFNEQHEPIKMIGTAQDITEAKRAAEALRRSEEQLRQSQKMEAVGRLAGGVAHDFNNLLTVIGGYSALMLQRLGDQDSLRSNAEEIQRASDRAAALTRQLLAFSRKQVLQPRVLDLNEIVAGMDKMLRRLIGEDIELRTIFQPSTGKVKADPGQIEQVILNMAVNARDAMPRGGKLTIRIANVEMDQATSFRGRGLEVGSYVMLAISDTGVGMTDEVKAHLFEPFFTTKGVDKGTGLGLATCYGIINQSGGDVRVYSEPNCGTTFKVYLPRIEEPHCVKLSPANSNKLPAGTESLLLVEDEKIVRKLAATVLRGCGYQVQEADNPLEALALIDGGAEFDLVVTDVIMPHMSGKELYDKIKARSGEAKVLFISGYTDDALANLGVLDGQLAFLEKPFSPARLARKVREVLDSPGINQMGPADGELTVAGAI
jgi:signal transduction histidine kinase